MSSSIKRRLTGYFISETRPALLVTAILCASLLFAFNALYNQPGKHPQPLWSFNSQSLVNNNGHSSSTSSVPVRKVETLKFSAPQIPIPMLRPVRIGEQTRNVVRETDQRPIDARKIQRLLRQLGYYHGELDGLLGPNTLLAVKKFEQSKGLPENANVSPSLLLLLQNAVDRSTAKPANGIGKLIERESSSTQLADKDNNQISPVMITRIQVGLINYGSDNVTIDGVLGDQTKIAIEQFQARFKLEVDGTPSQELIRKLESVGALTRG